MKQKTKIFIFIIFLLLVNFAAVAVVFGQTGNTGGGQNSGAGNTGGGPDGGNGSGATAGGCAPNTTLVNGQCVINNPAKQYLVDIPDFGALIIRAIEIALFFAGAIALLFLIIGGFQYIAARGNEETTEKAKKTISGAILGLIIIIMSYAIVTMINNLVVQGVPGGASTTSLSPSPLPPPPTPPGPPPANNIFIVVVNNNPPTYSIDDVASISFVPAPGGGYTWALTGDQLPDGLGLTTFGSNPPQINGTVSSSAEPGTYNLRITATGNGRTGTKDFQIIILEPGQNSP